MDNICLYLLDLIQNSIQAKASLIELTINETDDLEITIKDNGIGMNENELKQAISPFYTTRTTRSVGLGLSFVKQLIEQVEGKFEISSEKNKGTMLYLKFNLNHIDMPEIGDIGELVYFISIHQDVKDFRFKYMKGEQSYDYSLIETKEILKDVFQTYSVMKALITSINKEIDTIRGRT